MRPCTFDIQLRVYHLQELSVANLITHSERVDKENHFEELLKKDDRIKNMLEKIANLTEQTQGIDYEKGQLNKIQNKTERKMVSVIDISGDY